MSAYTDAVQHNIGTLKHVSTGGYLASCPDCDWSMVKDDNGNNTCDMSEGCNTEVCYHDNAETFSRDTCDCCGTYLAGSRTAGHGRDADGNLVHLSVCEDCVLYLAYGDEPETWG